jgi:TldD protein
MSSQKEFLQKLLPVMEANGCYAELLYLNERTLGINKDNASLDVAKHADEGVKLRLFDGQRWHEKGVSGWNEAKLRKAAKELGTIKKKPTTVKLEIPTENLEASYKALGKEDAAGIPLTKKISTVKSLHKELLAASKQLINGRVYYDEMRETKIYANKHRTLTQEISGCLVIMVAYVQSKDGDMRYHYKSFFDHGWERTKIPKKEIVELARFAERVAKAKKLTPGKYHCLLTPGMSGLLAHESFGHGMEADTIYKGRAKAGDYLGKRLASSKVSIADGPLCPGCHGFSFFDDEGFLATKTTMIEKGIVNLPLTDAYNAAQTKLPRSSNGRCESFDHKIYARMTNTYFEPGNLDKERDAGQDKKWAHPPRVKRRHGRPERMGYPDPRRDRRESDQRETDRPTVLRDWHDRLPANRAEKHRSSLLRI